MRPQVYRDERPADHFAPFHEWARTRDPDAVYELVHALSTLVAFAVFRLRVHRPEAVPASGPVILAANHASFLDHFFLAAALRRKVRFMAKSQLFVPPLEWVYTHGGVFPVRRGARDEEAFTTALSILARGGCVAMYPEAGRSRSGALAEHPKPGVGRLALESGAPVVPAAIEGSHRVREFRRGRFPRVTVHFGDLVRFDALRTPGREQQQAAADVIFAEVRALHDGSDAVDR